MKIIKVIKYFFILLSVAITTKVITFEILDNRPFKFEKYKTDEELENAIKLYFPLGSDLEQVVAALRKSRAECEIFKPIKQRNYEIGFSCQYIPNFISLVPIGRYTVTLYGNKDHKISHFYVLAQKRLELLWW